MNEITSRIKAVLQPILVLSVYRNKESGYNDEYYLESHDVTTTGQVLAGKPLQQETLQGIVDVFFDERKNAQQVSGLIPECLLSFTQMPGGKYNMIWYRPAERRVLLHKAQLKLPTGIEAWVPATIYKTDGRDLSVMAMATNGRPTSATKLYMPPYFNVSDNGSVCLGTANRAKPKRTYEDIIQYWEDLFWLGESSHVNGGEKVKCGSMAKAWQTIIKKQIKWSEAKELLPTKETLKSWI